MRPLPTSAKRPAVVAARAAAEETVREIMTQPVATITANDTLEAVRNLLIASGVSGLPVVDPEGRPIGMLSKTDLVRAQEYGPEVEELVEERDASARLGYEARLARLGKAAVGEVMTQKSVTLPVTATLAQAARIMAEKRIHRVIVVDVHGKVSGIVTSMDLLRWLGQVAPDPRAAYGRS